MSNPIISSLIRSSMAIVLCATPVAATTGQSWQFNIPRQSAASGIATFSRQAATAQLLVAQDALRGRWTNRLRGAYSIEGGLTVLLHGSGLRWLRTGPTTYSLVLSGKDSHR